jgi:hypothetical protein
MQAWSPVIVHDKIWSRRSPGSGTVRMTFLCGRLRTVSKDTGEQWRQPSTVRMDPDARRMARTSEGRAPVVHSTTTGFLSLSRSNV